MSKIVSHKGKPFHLDRAEAEKLYKDFEGFALVVNMLVLGKPKPWQRAASTIDWDWQKQKRVVGKHTPKETVTYQNAIRNVANLTLARDWPKDKRYRVLVQFRGTTGDVDNVAKSVMDALNKVAWNDDRQVDELTTRRLNYGDPRTEIRIEVVP